VKKYFWRLALFVPFTSVVLFLTFLIFVRGDDDFESGFIDRSLEFIIKKCEF